MKRLVWIAIVTLITILLLSSCKDAMQAPINLGSESTMSSPILAIGESWQGNMNGLIDVTAQYDTLTSTIYGTITNVASQKLCWVMSEPHMKLGTRTVGELGPEMLGHINPGEQVNFSMLIYGDPKYSGYDFDGYVLHMETYDCSGGTPDPY